MIKPIASDNPRVLAFEFSGKLSDEDYQSFSPVVDAAVDRFGKVRLLCRFDRFDGWDLSGAWADLKADVKHFASFERVALVGEKDWHAWMAKLASPFNKAEVKYFDESQVDEARQWAGEGV